MQYINIFAGYKTYITAFVLAALNLAVALNWISPVHLAQINAVLAAAGLGALRAGVSKVSTSTNRNG